MRMHTRKICIHCGSAVRRERNRELRKEYPYYCPRCDENMYGFEAVEKRMFENIRRRGT